jgi:hypothetical protein
VPQSIRLIEQRDRYHGGGLYEPPERCIDKHRAIAAPLKMERLTAARAVLAAAAG